MLLWMDSEVGRPLEAHNPWSPCTATSKVSDTPFAIACKRDAHLHELDLGHQIIETVARAKNGKGARARARAIKNVEELINAKKENEECALNVRYLLQICEGTRRSVISAPPRPKEFTRVEISEWCAAIAPQPLAAWTYRTPVEHLISRLPGVCA